MGRTRTSGQGRPKGVPNKNTTAVKDAILKCYDSIGGDTAFAEWAKSPKGKPIFYGQILPKVLPKEMDVKGSLEHGGEITITWKDKP